MKTILAVDKDADVHERETAEWVKYSINTVRIDTMTEAINVLVHKNDFIFVAINEDTIPDFMLQLRIMRDITTLPIFVVTSNYTIDKKIKAMDCGADVYDHFSAYIKNNVVVALELLKTKKRKLKHTPKQLQLLTGSGMILSPLYRNVFIRDAKVSLTKKEFDVLQCLMESNEQVVTHARLIRKVWGSKHDLKDTAVLWQTVDRLRRKLSQISPTNDYIEIEHGVGYRFSAPSVLTSYPIPKKSRAILSTAI